MSEKEIIDFTCVEIIHSLSETRSNKRISTDFGISYSQVNTWTTAAEKPEASTVSLDYYIYIFLEYFKRINISESTKIMEKYDLPADVDEIFLENEIFPENMLDSYLSSSILWKNDLITLLYTQNCHLLRTQLKVLEEFLKCTYEVPLDKKEISSGRISEFLQFKFPEHL